jgi:hypothetical protein
MAVTAIAVIPFSTWDGAGPEAAGKQAKRPAALLGAPASAAEIKQLVKDSQIDETLVIYGDPENFDPAILTKYWLPEENRGRAIKDVKASIGRLRRRGLHYGSGSRLLLFEFRYVRIFGKYAEVGTREHWILPLCRKDGSLARANDFGPYDVDYTLEMKSGKWLLVTTTTPYAEGE